MRRGAGLFLFFASCGRASLGQGDAGQAPALDAGPIAAEVALAPPPVGQGIQLEIAPFLVMPGSERHVCNFLKLPLTDRTFVRRVEVKFTPGSHHFNLYKSTASTFADGVIDCPTPADLTVFSPLAGSQTPDFSWDLPERSGLMIEGQVQLMMQAHYTNASAVPLGARVLVNLWTIPEADVENWVIPVFVINRAIDIPAHSDAFTTTMNCTFPLAARVLAMQGHFHRRGQTFVVHRFDPAEGVGAEVYRMTDWDHPPFQRFGEHEAEFGVGAGFRFACTYANDGPEAITWGPSAITNEHCNLMLYYMPGPKDGVSVSCIETSGQW